MDQIHRNASKDNLRGQRNSLKARGGLIVSILMAYGCLWLVQEIAELPFESVCFFRTLAPNAAFQTAGPGVIPWRTRISTDGPLDLQGQPL